MRINYVTGILGRRGSGKTFLIQKIIAAYRDKHPMKKILIVEKFGSQDYMELPIITPDHIKRWSGAGTYRVCGRPDPIHHAISNHLYNACIIIEDATRFISKNLTEDVRDFIIDSKQKNLDIVMVFHGFSSVPPEILKYIDILTIFKCDHPKCRKPILSEYDRILESYTE